MAKKKVTTTDNATYKQLIAAVERNRMVSPAFYDEKEVVLLRNGTGGYWVKTAGDKNDLAYWKGDGPGGRLSITEHQAVVARVKYIQKNGLETDILEPAPVDDEWENEESNLKDYGEEYAGAIPSIEDSLLASVRLDDKEGMTSLKAIIGGPALEKAFEEHGDNAMEVVKDNLRKANLKPKK